MTKKRKTLKVIICVLLALAMIGFISIGVIAERYGIYVAGEAVTRGNKGDILGDGTVYYDAGINVLTFNNATIESDEIIVYSKNDLFIELIGENKFICTSEVYSGGVYAGDYNIYKDLSFIGDGSLTIELQNRSTEAVGICASALTIANDVTVITADCEKVVHGIACDSSLMITGNGTVTVKNGAAQNSIAVRVRGNALFEAGAALDISVNPGTTEICKGLSVSGDILLGKDTSLAVSVDDTATDLGECIRVSGLMEIGVGSTVTASTKNSYAIECFGAIEANKGASISAVSDKKDADIFCSGAVVNCGATIDGEIDAIGGIHNRDEN
ncbi:MAG: hypothetical protein II239_00900 [Peptococcaceae bacterium]|nr:hypothetical protein [Peptococcaceae bacterium]